MFKTKEKFLKDVRLLLENCLKEGRDSYNQKLEKDYLNISHILIMLKQELSSYECQDFIFDISDSNYFLNFKEDLHTGKNTIDVEVLTLDARMVYKIDFYYELELLGYCECTKKDNNYNENYDCCGVSCDWYKPYMSITKTFLVSEGSFKGKQKELWEMEERINKDIVFQKRCDELNHIKKEIERLQERYKHIENEIDNSSCND